MTLIYILLGLTITKFAHADFESCIIECDYRNINIHMHETVTIPFSILVDKIKLSSLNISAYSSDENIAKIGIPRLDTNTANSTITGAVNISGVFLGSARLLLTLNIDEIVVTSRDINVVVIREYRLIDTIFTASVASLISILYINFGCAMDWEVCHKTLKRPIGPLIGVICQFIFMPVISYIIAILLFPDNPEMQLGIFFTGISPSGGASNIWTILLGGNLNLSVTMTTLGTLAAFGLMPLWLFTVGRHIFQQANLVMPYEKIATIIIGLIVPLAIGYIIQRKLPRLSKLMVRIIKPFSILLIIFIIIFATVTNVYLFKLFSKKIIIAGLGLPWVGFTVGLIIATFLRQTSADVRAIAIEIGVQNTGIAIFLLRFSLNQPAADLTTVIPVACAIMTPLPLAVLYVAKLILDSRGNDFVDCDEKLKKPMLPENVFSDTTGLVDHKRIKTLEIVAAV